MYQRGDTLGDYVVEKRIGQGSVASVYRVRSKSRGTIHAAKILTSTVVSARQRFLQEGRIQARFRHPNVVEVTDFVPVDGAMAMVMEYVAGPNLHDWLERNEPDLDEALELFAGIVRGVAAVHAQGAVHRDVKPSNILLEQTERGLVPKLTDFGLVLQPAALDEEEDRLTLHGAFLGSPSYMAPEQILDARWVDHRADLWSLGCVLYELVCHRCAFPGTDNLQVANDVIEGRYAPAEELMGSLPPPVRQAIQGLLKRDPDARIPSCEALWALLFGDTRGPLLAPAGAPAPDAFDEPSVAETFMLFGPAVHPSPPRQEPPKVGWMDLRATLVLIGAGTALALSAWWLLG